MVEATGAEFVGAVGGHEDDGPWGPAELPSLRCQVGFQLIDVSTMPVGFTGGYLRSPSGIAGDGRPLLKAVC